MITLLFTGSENHNQSWLEVTSRGHLIQPPTQSRGLTSTSGSGQLWPCLTKSLKPYRNRLQHPLGSLCKCCTTSQRGSFSRCPAGTSHASICSHRCLTCHYREEFHSVISVTALQVVVGCSYIPPWLPLGGSQQSQLPQPQLTCASATFIALC